MSQDEEIRNEGEREQPEDETPIMDADAKDIIDDESESDPQNDEQEDDKQVISDILMNLGDYPVPEIDEDEDDELQFDVDFFNRIAETASTASIEQEQYFPKKVKSSAGNNYIQVYENFGYVCSNCGTEVPIKSKSCPCCNVRFAYIKCEKCRYVGVKNDFKDHVCPQCQTAPVEITNLDLDVNLCGGCHRPYSKGEFRCKLCGWVDFGAFAWLASLVLIIGVAMPLFSLLFQGITREIILYSGLIFGGLTLWNFIHAVIRAFDRPRRASFYWFCAIVSTLILIILSMTQGISFEARAAVIHSFFFIVIIGEIFALLRRKSRFFKGKPTVGLIIRKHLYSPELFNEFLHPHNHNEDSSCRKTK